MSVPAETAGVLLEYAYRFRSSAMRIYTSGPDVADDITAAATSIAYCKALLWIKPLLAVIDKGKKHQPGIGQIELNTKNQGWLVLEHTGISERRLYLT